LASEYPSDLPDNPFHQEDPFAEFDISPPESDPERSENFPEPDFPAPQPIYTQEIDEYLAKIRSLIENNQQEEALELIAKLEKLLPTDSFPPVPQSEPIPQPFQPLTAEHDWHPEDIDDLIERERNEDQGEEEEAPSEEQEPCDLHEFTAEEAELHLPDEEQQEEIDRSCKELETSIAEGKEQKAVVAVDKLERLLEESGILESDKVEPEIEQFPLTQPGPSTSKTKTRKRKHEEGAKEDQEGTLSGDQIRALLSKLHRGILKWKWKEPRLDFPADKPYDKVGKGILKRSKLGQLILERIEKHSRLYAQPSQESSSSISLQPIRSLRKTLSFISSYKRESCVNIKIQL